MFEFDIIQSGLVIAALFVLGELISRKLRAIIPAVLVSGILFMALCGAASSRRIWWSAHSWAC